MKRLLVLCVAILFILSCKEETFSNDDCNVLDSQEEVYELIDECNENKLQTKSEIEESLIGDWTLSGIIPGWVAFEPISECLLLSIDSESLTLRNLDTGEELSSAWEIIFYEVNDYPVFYLKPNNEEMRWKVGMQFFSENIIYGAGNADDTDNYVYEKVK